MKIKLHLIEMVGLVALGTLGVAGVAAAEEYKLDPVHSRIGFAVGHLGITKTKGAFTNYTGTITHEPGKPASLDADVTIQVSSVDTGSDGRDEHILGPDFFDAEKFPEIRFNTQKAEKEDDQLYLVGDFTMHGVTKRLRLPVSLNGPIDDPWGNRRIGLSTMATINRHDYGVGSDKLSDKMVGDEVTLEIEFEAVAKSAE